jgi:hypothetical protein
MFNSLAFIFFAVEEMEGGKIYRQGYAKSIKQYKRPIQLLPLPLAPKETLMYHNSA